MKNFNIFGVHWKIQVLGWVEFTKNQYKGWDYLEIGVWTVCKFKGGDLASKRGVMFFLGEGVDTLMHTMGMNYPNTNRVKTLRSRKDK